LKEGVFVIKRILLIAVNALLLIAFIVCLSLSASHKNTLRSQQAAAAWAGQSGERFSQLSVFFPESFEFDEASIRNLHTSIDNALQTVSLESTQGRILYTDAWSGVANVSIYHERGPISAKAIAVGGDFFLFHPFNLRSGGYLSPNDVMKDRVVLDEELAWRLFGSAHLEGFEILINNRPFTIAGVISRETDFASSKAYADGAGLFMSFEAMKDLVEMTGGEAKILCYEIVMPDPISGFALKSLTDAIPDQSVHIVENTTRFSLSNLFAAIRAFGERSMRMDSIEYPYWENAARYIEDWLALLLALTILFIIFPFVCGVVYTVKIIRFLIRRSKSTARKAIEKHDKRQYDKYMIKHGTTVPDETDEADNTLDDNTDPEQDQEPEENQDTYSITDILEHDHESDGTPDNFNVEDIIREVQDNG